MVSFVSLFKTRHDLLRLAAKHYGVSRITIARRALSLKKRNEIGFQDALACGLLDPHISLDAEDGSIAPSHLMSLQTKINPSRWMCLTEDKAVFHAYCQSVGLSVAPYLAIFDVNGGWTADGKLLYDRSEWENFFRDLPDEFITKPVLGFQGEGLTVYRQRPSASELYERLSGERFVIQPRIKNHQAIRDLTGTEALQTVRIVTWLTGSGDVQIFITLFKIIVGDNMHDNYHNGLNGNLTANIDPVTGILDSPTGPTPDKIGFRVVKDHPMTGFRLPYWEEARDLACQAARLFRPLRSIGWDIALMQDKAILMEGNSMWASFNHLVCAATPQRQAQIAELMHAMKSAAL